MSALFGFGGAGTDPASMESVQGMFAQIMSAVQKSVSHFWSKICVELLSCQSSLCKFTDFVFPFPVSRVEHNYERRRR